MSGKDMSGLLAERLGEGCISATRQVRFDCWVGREHIARYFRDVAFRNTKGK